MAFRVAQIGTGNVGRHALAALITDQRFELTAVCVSSESQAGCDAAELVGLSRPTGVTATANLDEILESSPECAVYTTMADSWLQETLEDYRRLLAAGINVVGSGPPFLQYPYGVIPEAFIAPLEGAAREGNSSLFVSEIDPGPASDLLPLVLARACQNVEQVRCTEIIDYSTYDNPTVLFGIMGFGKPLDEVPVLLAPTTLSMAWGSVVRQLAAGVDVVLDGLEEVHHREPAPEDFEIAAGRIAKGTAAALRFEVRGLVDKRPVVILEHVTRLRDDLCPHWPRPVQPGGSYRVEITGEPSYAMDLCLSSRKGDHNHAGLVASAMRIVNAIPAVVAAEPGIRSTLDLPVLLRNGLYPA